MFEKIRITRNVVMQVLSQRKYFFIFFLTSVVSFAIFYVLTLVNIANQSLKIFIMMSGWNYTFTNFVISGVIALLFGIYVSLFFYKFRLIRCEGRGWFSGIFGSGGLIVGLFSAGCPTCGAFLFALFGAPLALMMFPFQGLELKVLSIILLLISIYFLSRSLIECKIRLG